VPHDVEVGLVGHDEVGHNVEGHGEVLRRSSRLCLVVHPASVSGRVVREGRAVRELSWVEFASKI